MQDRKRKGKAVESCSMKIHYLRLCEGQTEEPKDVWSFPKQGEYTLSC